MSFLADFLSSIAGAAATVIVDDRQTFTTYVDANGVLAGRTISTSSGGPTVTKYYDADMEFVGTSRVTVSGDRTTNEFFDEFGQPAGVEKVTDTPDFTLTETLDSDWQLTGAVKSIHTATQTGQQVYDADYNLVSAHLVTDNGFGQVKVEDCGPAWSLISCTTVTTSGDKVVTEHKDAGGITGGSIVLTKAEFTLTETFGPGWTWLGAVKEIHTATQTGQQVYDGDNLLSAHLVTDNGLGQVKVEDYGPNWALISRSTVTTTGDQVITEHMDSTGVTGGSIITAKPDFTLIESFGSGWVRTGAIKEIHTATTTGQQMYDGGYNLVSAHLEINDGLGQVKILDYDLDWVLLTRTTITTSGNKMTTVHEEGGLIVGGSTVVTKADFTLTETFGPGWERTGAVKEIHTATTTGQQVYDADYNLISAHLEGDNGHGRTKVEEYGPDWSLISKTTVSVSGDKVTTEHMDSSGVTGGTIVTTKPQFTLTETFGAGWVLLGAVKAVHSATTTGEQVYDGDYNLISAHLEVDNGYGQTKVEDYGPNWFLISKTTVTVTDDKVFTEYQENGAGNVAWTSSKVGDGADAATKYTGFGAADNVFVGDVGKDTMYGNEGEDSLFGMGNDDYLRGGNGNDLLDGGAAEDILIGDAGNDTLFGGSGHDTLYGGADADTLVGGLGRDTMFGGAGTDCFVFNSAIESGVGSAVRDQIRDFVLGEDTIDLSGVAATAGLASLNFLAAEGAAFTGSAGDLTFDQMDKAGNANDVTFIRADLDGDGAADFEVQLTGLHNLTAASFIL